MHTLLVSFKRLVPRQVINSYHFAVAFAAVVRYRYPARKLKVIGVTGTDGKTTTSTLIYHLLNSAGKKVALITSVAAYIGDKQLETGLHVTSPDPMELQRLLREIVDKGFDHVVLESTSHGLDQHRLLGANTKVGVLTNITPEHMLYHKTMTDYTRSKAKLFRHADYAILNKTDSSFAPVKKLLPPGIRVLPYDLTSLSGGVKTAVWARFPEKYNRLNATAAILAARIFKVSDTELATAIASFPGVPGRMEDVPNTKGLRIVVDFAHTINGLKSVLTALSGQKGKGRLIAVFGCASERDDEKRPVMAKLATRIADEVVFTAEDPRYEPIDKILDDMVAGVGKHTNYHCIPERGEAISFAINKLAKKGDTVVLCGKGHEKSMAYSGVEYPWSDFAAISDALAGKVKKIARPR